MTLLFSSAGRRVELIDCFRQSAAELGFRLRILAADAKPALSVACHRVDRAFSISPCAQPAFVDELLAMCAEERVSLLIPTIDPELAPIARNADRFVRAGTLPSVSTTDVVAIARNKLETFRFLSGLKIPTPKTAVAREFLRSPGDWRFPVILKPISGSASTGLRLLRSPSEAAGLGSLEAEDCLAQEFWHGKEYTVNMFFDRSRLRCVIPHHRLEVRAGEVSKGRTERVPELIRLAEKIGASFAGRAFGALCFQAVIREDGQVAVFELNARFGGGYPLAHAAGAEFAKWLLELASGKVCSAHNDWRENLLMLRYDAAVYLQN